MTACGRNVCSACQDHSPWYWELMWDYWRRQLSEYGVEWDPTLQF